MRGTASVLHDSKTDRRSMGAHGNMKCPLGQRESSRIIGFRYFAGALLALFTLVSLQSSGSSQVPARRQFAKSDSGTFRATLHSWRIGVDCAATIESGPTANPNRVDINIPVDVSTLAVTDVGQLVVAGEVVDGRARQTAFAIYDRKGSEILQVRRAQLPSESPHEPMRLVAKDVMLDMSNRIAVIRHTDARSNEIWTSICVETGEIIGDMNLRSRLPSCDRVGGVILVKSIDAPGHFVVQWARYGGDVGTTITGFVYSVVDVRRGFIWSVDAENALVDMSSDERARYLHDGSIEIMDKKAFSILMDRSASRPIFALAHGGSGFVVRKVE